MTKDEAIKYLIKPISTSTIPSEEIEKQFQAYEMAVEALKQKPITHAHWIVLPPCFEEICMCSNCETKFEYAYQLSEEYCPNCKAKMDEKV